MPRLPYCSWPAVPSPVRRSVLALFCVPLPIMLALPIPFGDLLPALTLIVLAFGLMQRDGIVVSLGLGGAVACGVYLALVWSAVTGLFVAAARWIGGLAG